MRSLRKYFFVARARFVNQYAHRLSFCLERLRNILILLFIFGVWTTVSRRSGSFAGFSHEQLVTYVALAHLLRALVFGSQARKTAEEIADGRFSIYLTQPVNHFTLSFFRELGEQISYVISAFVELAVFIVLTRESIVIQSSPQILTIVFLSVILANILYSVLTYSVHLIAFWSYESMGPRFLFEWMIELASGAYVPLKAAGPFMFAALQGLPFFYLIYAPIHIYFGVPPGEAVQIVAIQVFWIIAAGFVSWIVWKRGIRRYCGEGI